MLVESQISGTCEWHLTVALDGEQGNVVTKLMEILTETCVLRPRALRDVSDLSRYYTENADHLRKWDPLRPEGYHRQLAWMDRVQADGPDEVHLIARRSTAAQDIAAVISFTGIMRGAFQACYMGFSVDHRLEGTGLMYEVAEAAIQHMFTTEGLHRIMASHMPENTRSAALLDRLGFQNEGLARRYLKIQGAWRDHVLTARLNDECDG